MEDRGVVEGEIEVEAFEKREPIVSISISISVSVSVSIFLLNTVSSKT